MGEVVGSRFQGTTYKKADAGNIVPVRVKILVYAGVG